MTKYALTIGRAELLSWVLFQDSRLLILNKTAGHVCHPCKAGPLSCIAGAIKHHLNVSKAHLMSRLDRETSGVLVIAKDAVTARRLQMTLQKGNVGKRYIALLEGRFGMGGVQSRIELGMGTAMEYGMEGSNLKEGGKVGKVVRVAGTVARDKASLLRSKWRLESPVTVTALAANEKGEREPAVSGNNNMFDPKNKIPDLRNNDAQEGKRAESLFKLLSMGPRHSLVEVVPLTGRSHQIRLHAQAIGHPVVGDKVYGPSRTTLRTMHASANSSTLLDSTTTARHCVENSDSSLPESRFLDFLECGLTGPQGTLLLEDLQGMPRHALHCCQIDLKYAMSPFRNTNPRAATQTAIQTDGGGDVSFQHNVFAAPLPDDMLQFCRANEIPVPHLFEAVCLKGVAGV